MKRFVPIFLVMILAPAAVARAEEGPGPAQSLPEAAQAVSTQVAAPAAAEADPFEPVQAVVDRALGAYGALNSYQAHLHRELRLKDGRMKSEEMFLRCDKPHTVFLKYLTGSSATLQVLYSEGNFGGKLMTRPPGLFFDFIPIQAMDPADPRVTSAENRPIQDAGIGHMIEKFSADLAEARISGLARVVSLAPAEGMSGVTRLEVVLDLPGRTYPKTVMYFEDGEGLPIGMEMAPADGPATEIYRYSDFQPDPAKDDAVFLRMIDRRILVDSYQKI